MDEPSYTIRGHGPRHGILYKHHGRSRFTEADRPVITGGGARSQFWTEFAGRPATTVQGDPRMWPPGHHTQRKTTLRRLTTHECARLQSFPNSFRFIGTKTAKYRMIGNAVPPLMANAIAEALLAD